MQHIVDTAVADSNFRTLVAAVTATSFVKIFKGPGSFTVFAPTDKAFAKLPKGAIESLWEDILQPKSILIYHVVAGKVLASAVRTMDGKDATSVQGEKIKISTENGFKLNGKPTVSKTDILCSDGVIHVIDSVIVPQSLDGTASKKLEAVAS